MKTFNRMVDTATADKIREWAKAFNVASFIGDDPLLGDFALFGYGINNNKH